MSGGLLQGSCGGLLKGCCHRTAKSANLGSDAGNTIDLTDLPNVDYGPVINDPSEFDFFFQFFGFIAYLKLFCFYLKKLNYCNTYLYS